MRIRRENRIGDDVICGFLRYVAIDAMRLSSPSKRSVVIENASDDCDVRTTERILRSANGRVFPSLPLRPVALKCGRASYAGPTMGALLRQRLRFLGGDTTHYG